MFDALKRLFAAKIPADPERPTQFGYKVDWLAFRSADPAAVIRELRRLDPAVGKGEAVPCSWSRGVQRKGIFVTPSVDGWVLVLNYIPEHDFDELLRGLSAALDTRVCHFGSMRGVSYVGYGLAEHGELLRLYANADGESYWDVGPPTADERELGLRFFEELEGELPDEEEEAIFEAMPDELTVDELAARWSVNPNSEDWSDHEAGVGWLLR